MVLLGILIFFLLVALFLLFVIGSAFLGFVATRVPFVPTPADDIEQLVKHLQLSQDDVFYELGSGNGRVVMAVESLSPARVVGYESTLWTHLWARLAKAWRGAKRAKLIYGNFFRHNWNEATVIYCYLYPPLMPTVSAKILAECRPGTRIASRDFPIGGLKEVGRLETRPKHTIFIYQV